MNDKISQVADAQGLVGKGAKAGVPAELQKPIVSFMGRTLSEAGEFTIIFADGKGFKCRLQESDRYNLIIIESTGRRLLIPKHSIKYIILSASNST